MMKLRSKKGISIIEMLVSVVIIGLVSILAVTAYLTASKSTKEVNSAAYSQTVSSTLMNKMSEEITSAVNEIWISSDSSMIALEAGDNLPVVVCAANKNVSTSDKVVRYDSFSNYLQLYYLDINDGHPYSLWTYPKESYMGYVITDLKFTPQQKNSEVLIKITCTITNPSTEYSFTNTKVVPCTNIESMDKVQIKGSTQNQFLQDFEYNFTNQD